MLFKIYFSLQLDSSGISTEEIYQHMSRSTGKQYHSIAEKILIKMFAPFAAAAIESDPTNAENCVDFSGFNS